MSAENQLYYLSDEPRVAQAVEAVVARAGEGLAAVACRDLADLSNCLEREPSAVVLADIDPPAAHWLERLEPIISRHPMARFVLVSDRQDNRLILDAMHVGARHVLAKDDVPNELLNVLTRFGQIGQSRGPHGALVTVLSAGGGCGGTTIAVNLAYELHLTRSQPSLLMDLDGALGGLGIHLGLHSKYGVADVLARCATFDPQFVRSTATAYNDGLHVLLSPASVNFAAPAPMNFQNLSIVLESCREAYGYTVVDAPRVPMTVASTLGRASRVTVIVMQLTVKELHIARDMRQALIDGGVPADRILPLANRYHKRHSQIGFEEASRAMGDGRLRPIVNDYRGAVRGINHGQPLAEAAPISALRKDIRKLAETLSLMNGSTFMPAGER